MKTFILLFICLMAINLQAQQSINAVSKPKSVTLFLSGAQVTRTANVNLQAGITDVIFPELSDNIDPNTIRVTGQGAFTIISVNLQSNFLKSKKELKDAETLKLRKKEILKLLDINAGDQNVLLVEENLLKANQNLHGDDKNITAAEIKVAADFYRERFTELSRKSIDLKDRKSDLDQELNKINEQLAESGSEELKPTGEIIVQVMAKTAINVDITISYIVRKASWTPEFDLRLENISRPLEVTRRAKYTQSSGEDWNEVQLTFSTGNPTESGTEPILSPWYIGGDYYSNSNYKSGSGNNLPAIIQQPKVNYPFNGILTGKVFDAETGEALPFINITVPSRSGVGTVSDIDGNYRLTVNYGESVTASFVGYNKATFTATNPVINIGMRPSYKELDGVVVTALGIKRNNDFEEIEEVKVPEAEKPEILISDMGSVRSVQEYTLQMPMTLPSDSKEYNIIIGEENITALYEFHASPKLDNDAFLIARIPNWQEYNLIDAKAGIYYEGTFTGQTRLSADMAVDTLNISLGRDKSIIIDRKKITDNTNSQLIGSNRTLQRSWEITVRNNKKQAVDLIVYDHYPVSREDEIVVTLIDNGNASADATTGKLMWKLHLDPGKLVKLKYAYTIKFPKNRAFQIE